MIDSEATEPEKSRKTRVVEVAWPTQTDLERRVAKREVTLQ